MARLAPTTTARYDVHEEVGRGGMAVVYRGVDRSLQREVAIKVLHPHLADQEESRRRLQREALAVAKLRHDNILEIFDYSGPDAEDCFIVTEFIRGPTLRAWLDQGHPVRPVLAAVLVSRLCRALSHAHAAGIVHRDIKPENIMIRSADGCLKLMDFGIAQILDTQRLTLTGQLLGSPAYMAPEVIRGRPLDRRTDLFSLGVLLYQMSTGRLPFDGRNPHEVLSRIADGEFTAPTEASRLVDPELETIIRRALALNPDDRYQDAGSLAAELEAYLEDLQVEAGPSELRHYFANPASYCTELDQRVCKVLGERAHQALVEGHHARAMRILGRVLDIDPTHAAARTLLARLRGRERRMRQILGFAAGAAALGLGWAGFVLLTQSPGAGQVAETSSHASKIEISGTSVDPSPSPEQVPSPSAPPSDAPALDPSRLLDAPSSRLTSPTPPLTASSTLASPLPSARGNLRGPGRTPSDPPHDAHAPRAPSPGTARGRLEAGPTGQRSGFRCKVEVIGLPRPAAEAHALVSDSDRWSTRELVRTLDITAEALSVRLDGPRYTSQEVTLSPERCRTGTVPVRAEPRAAQLEITQAPPGTVVICEEGCPTKMLGVNQDPRRFAPIPMQSPGQHVKLTFKRRDYRSEAVTWDLVPGHQLRAAPRLEPTR